MKKTNFLKLIVALVIGAACFSACEERVPSLYTEYNPKPITADPGNLIYEGLISYPELTTISTDTPQVLVEGVYKFRLDTIIASEGASFNQSMFAIDSETGVVTYDNKNGDITMGLYHVSVNLSNTAGIAIFDDVSQIEILDVPVSATVDNAAVDAGALQLGVLSTVSYTDDSPEGSIVSVTYALANAVDGFEINAETGEISKTGSAAEGENVISVTLITNLGSKSFENLVTVTVGTPPTIEYVQADGTSALTNVTLSPWTAYTSYVPVLSGMEASGGWEAILPEGLDPAAVIANADGSISVLADQNIAVGEYKIGVKATNGGQVSFEFPEQFTLTVETRWSDLFVDDFNDGQVGDLVTLYPDYTNYTLSGTNEWTKVKLTKAGLPDIEGLRRFNPATSDACVVRKIDNIAGIKAIKVSFDEVFGYNDAFITKFDRGFYFGENVSGLESGTFVDGDWNVIMDASDLGWTGSSTWSTRTPTTVQSVDVNLENVIGTTIYLAWRLSPKAGETQGNGQYVLDKVSVTASTAFTAEEE